MTASSKNHTLNFWLIQSTRRLKAGGITSPGLDNELLACFVLSKPRTWVHAHPEYELTKSEHQTLEQLLQRRLSHEPIAYIVGEKEFYGCTFSVNESVLVPRPESEDFIDIIKTLPGDLKFIDIGTGSGILAVTAVLEQQNWSGVATDTSREALKVAQQNALKLGAKNLVFKVQNLLSNDQMHYDLVIANLPYVPKKLHGKADISHEPNIALFADHNGLALYEELFDQLAKLNQKPKHILTESLLEQHKSLALLAKDAGYRLVETRGLIQYFVRAG